MAELINFWQQAPDGVKAFFGLCVLVVVIGAIVLISESVEESRHEKTHWRRGHG